ncbi:MAG: DNA/RNA nuclease SfsA [Pseudomonadota bacterium]
MCDPLCRSLYFRYGPAMEFTIPLLEGILEQRYKRFLADIRIPDGSIITAHCPNSGAMMGLNQPGARAFLSKSDNPKRKLAHTLEMLEVQAPDGPVMVGINTMHPNKLAKEAIEAGRLPSLNGYETLRKEVRYGENSRIDILLESEGKPPCYVEVKNVHLVRQSGLHEFPDCRTERGTKHLRELTNVVKAGNRAVMLYIIQRGDGDRLAFASDLDPDYAATLAMAHRAGVEVLALVCHVSPQRIEAIRPVPVDMPAV